MKRKRLAILLATLPTVGGAVGCAPTAQQRAVGSALFDYEDGDFRQAEQRLAPLSAETNENYVLNNLRLGSAALAGQNLGEAERAFLRAYEVINATGVNDPARSAAAVIFDEKVKVFKGEPFERAMANFYLGLVYYIKHDYDNARAAFENSLFKLRNYDSNDPNSANSEQQESNFALSILMLGRTFQRLGREDLAKANFDRVRQLRPDLAGLADYDLEKRSNLLLVVDMGFAPEKVTDFDGSIVGYQPTPYTAGPIPRVRVDVDGGAVPTGEVRPPIDLVALAQDRRWQSIDTIRAVKSGIGTGLLAAGGIVGINELNRGNPNGDHLAVAAGLLAAGLFAKLTSQADTRRWEMLPRTTLLIPLIVDPGTHDVTIDFPAVPGLRQTLRGLQVPAEGEATYYVRMLRNVNSFGGENPNDQTRMTNLIP